MTEAVLTISNEHQSSTDFTVSTAINLDVILSDPCEATSIGSLSIDPLSVIDGSTTSTEWDPPAVQVDTDNDNTGLCGDVKFAVYSDTSDTELSKAWAVVIEEDDGKWSLNIDTNVDL